LPSKNVLIRRTSRYQHTF
jgi:hypothetical protein